MFSNFFYFFLLIVLVVLFGWLTWTREQFIQVMRTGIRPGGTELKMPWKNATKMSDADLGALYTYLTTAL
jgi:hypothetical protein